MKTLSSITSTILSDPETMTTSLLDLIIKAFMSELWNYWSFFIFHERKQKKIKSFEEGHAKCTGDSSTRIQFPLLAVLPSHHSITTSCLSYWFRVVFMLLWNNEYEDKIVMVTEQQNVHLSFLKSASGYCLLVSSYSAICILISLNTSSDNKI